MSIDDRIHTATRAKDDTATRAKDDAMSRVMGAMLFAGQRQRRPLHALRAKRVATADSVTGITHRDCAHCGLEASAGTAAGGDSKCSEATSDE